MNLCPLARNRARLWHQERALSLTTVQHAAGTTNPLHSICATVNTAGGGGRRAGSGSGSWLFTAPCSSGAARSRSAPRRGPRRQGAVFLGGMRSPGLDGLGGWAVPGAGGWLLGDCTPQLGSPEQSWESSAWSGCWVAAALREHQ